jgi:copper chaperone CopZ
MQRLAVFKVDGRRNVCYDTEKQLSNCLIVWNPEGGPEMKKTYKIDVDCANCANKMEQAAKKTKGVKDATVNFMALKMKVEFEDGADPAAVMQDVLKNCKVVEDDCEIFL